MDHNRETFASAFHNYRRLMCLRSLIHQALFATDELDDELPSYTLHIRNWQHRMFLMRQTLLDLTHLCDQEIQRAQQFNRRCMHFSPMSNITGNDFCTLPACSQSWKT